MHPTRASAPSGIFICITHHCVFCLSMYPHLRLLLQSGSHNTQCVDWLHTHILLNLWHSISKRASSSLSLSLSPYNFNSTNLHETIVNDLAFFLSRLHIVSITLCRGKNKKVSTRDALRLYRNVMRTNKNLASGSPRTIHWIRANTSRITLHPEQGDLSIGGSITTGCPYRCSPPLEIPPMLE